MVRQGLAVRRFSPDGKAPSVARAERQADAEHGALAGPAADLDRSVHALGELLADRQAQAGAAVLARNRRVGLDERLVDMGDLVFAHADSRILDLEQQVGALFVAALEGDAHDDAAGCR
jgi:hypothetical protein